MDDSEDNIKYGTPLELLDEDNYYNQKIPRREDETATDLQGRRRFHGAFTGGFSAGYFNTVGSKDGWAPSTFVSKRDKEAKKDGKYTQEPRDFMDDEDLASHGIMPQVLRTTDSYSTEEAVKKRKRQEVSFNEGPIPGDPVLKDLLTPLRISVGSQLLVKFGWKAGQGIGPRLSNTEKKKQEIKVYGCQRPDDQDKDECEIEEDKDDKYSGATFAPFDAKSQVEETKNDTFGLGYKPLSRSNVLGHFSLFDSQPLKITENNKKVHIHGQAFGVGAFEEDDDDIYTKEDMSNYDFDLGSKKDGGKKTQENTFKAIGYISDHLAAFKISCKPPVRSKYYPLPKLPKDYVPRHKQRLRFERLEREIQGLGRHDLSIEDRRKLIAGAGNSKVEIRTGVKKSEVVEAVSPDTGQSSNIEIPQPLNDGNDSSRDSGFKPFPNEAEKQKRYELYVRMRDKNMKDKFPLVQPNSLTEWQKERERREFEKAHLLFRPLSFTMASRFTAASTESVPQMKAGLGNIEESIRIAEELKKVSPSDIKSSAAQMRQYGILTQAKIEWHPDPVLCKRFNVPNPYPKASFVGCVGSAREKPSIFNHLLVPKEDTLTNLSPDRIPASLPDSKMVEFENSSSFASQENNKEILSEKADNYGLKVSTDGPPTLDLFKAIFENSDTESEDEESESNPRNTDLSHRIGNFESVEPNIEKQTKDKADIEELASKVQNQASGIFKNLDFSELNRYRTESFNTQVSNVESKECSSVESRDKESSPNESCEVVHQIISIGSDSDDEGDEYMPSLPPHLVNRQEKNVPEQKVFLLEKSIELDIVKIKEKILFKKYKKQKKAKDKGKKEKHKNKKSKKSKKESKKRKKKHKSSSSSSSD